MRSLSLGKNGKLLNLVPVSASIYGGRFRCGDLGSFGHMDPSVTLVSIAVAIGTLIQKDIPVPPLALYFYEEEVYNRANEYMAL